MTCTLLMRAVAPMQSWGNKSLFDYRETCNEVTKAGWAGLVASACNIPITDDDWLARFNQLRMGVRVDKEGTLGYEFQTAGGMTYRRKEFLEFSEKLINDSCENPDYKWPMKDYSGVAKSKAGSRPGTVVIHRFYLVNACFVIGLEGEKSFLDEIANAVNYPARPLYLGRKRYVPTMPIFMGPPLEKSLETALRETLWQIRIQDKLNGRKFESSCHGDVRYIIESKAGAFIRKDVNLSFVDRFFTARLVDEFFEPIASEQKNNDEE